MTTCNFEQHLKIYSLCLFLQDAECQSHYQQMISDDQKENSQTKFKSGLTLAIEELCNNERKYILR